MKKIILSIIFLLIQKSIAFANPACAVCTVAIGASLGLARYLGINDNVVGLWAGALLTLLGYWSIVWFDRKNWNFYGRDALLMLLSLSMAGVVYIKDIQYSPQILGFLDPFLFSVIVGSIVFVFSQKLYQWLKKKNGGHAHFPFEKVVMPVAMLFVLSFLFNYIY